MAVKSDIRSALGGRNTLELTDLEQGVAIGAVHKRVVAGAALVRDAGQVGVALLTVLADHGAVIVGVGGQEVLGVVVAVHNDLAQRVVHGRVGAALRHQVLQEGVQQLQPVALLHLHVNRFQENVTGQR